MEAIESDVRQRNVCPARKKNAPPFVSLLNIVMKGILTMGFGVGGKMGPKTVLITIRGRRSGKEHTTPVGLFELSGHRYLFGTFGDVDWTRNLSVAAVAILSGKRRRETVSAVRLAPQHAANILREVLRPYLNSRVGRSFIQMGYDLTAGSSLEDYRREAEVHPGFELFSPSNLPATEKAADGPKQAAQE